MLSSEQAVVVGVDGSEGSNLALKWAADEAGLRGVVLRIVCAGSAHPRGGASFVTADVFHLSAAGVVMETAVGLVATRHPGVAMRGETPEGPTVDVLVEAS